MSLIEGFEKEGAKWSVLARLIGNKTGLIYFSFLIWIWNPGANFFQDVQCKYFYEKYYLQNKKSKQFTERQKEAVMNGGREVETNWTSISNNVNKGSKFHHSPLQCYNLFQDLNK